MRSTPAAPTPSTASRGSDFRRVDYAIDMAGSVKPSTSRIASLTRRHDRDAGCRRRPHLADVAGQSRRRRRTIKGSYIGTCVPSRDLPRFIDLYRQGRHAGQSLMSGKLSLDEIKRVSTCFTKPRRCARCRF